MGRRGAEALPQAEKRERYARLVAQGCSNSEACRIVEINRRTGKRWRHGRTITTRDGRKLHYAPVVAAGAARRGREISDRYLSEQERVRIADLRQAGGGVRAIAEQTGRSPPAISRELRRNRDPGSGQYRPFTAHKLAVRRRARPRQGKIAADPVLRQSCRSGWGSGGARSRSARRCAASSPMSRPGMSCTRRSIRGLPSRAGRAVPGVASPGAGSCLGRQDHWS
jgi:transposase